MTSLFFIMLVLYVLTFAVLKFEKEKYKAEADQLKKIKEIEKSINEIDTTLFIYNSQHKKHVLNIQVSFPKLDADIRAQNSPKTLANLVLAGKKILKLVERINEEENVKYLVIIEGQASKDSYEKNYQLSYDRALALLKFWEMRGVNMQNNENIELIIAGSGTGGIPRNQPDRPPRNQRFLIHIIPKVGEI